MKSVTVCDIYSNNRLSGRNRFIIVVVCVFAGFVLIRQETSQSITSQSSNNMRKTFTPSTLTWHHTVQQINNNMNIKIREFLLVLSGSKRAGENPLQWRSSFSFDCTSVKLWKLDLRGAEVQPIDSPGMMTSGKPSLRVMATPLLNMSGFSLRTCSMSPLSSCREMISPAGTEGGREKERKKERKRLKRDEDHLSCIIHHVRLFSSVKWRWLWSLKLKALGAPELFVCTELHVFILHNQNKLCLRSCGFILNVEHLL